MEKTFPGGVNPGYTPARAVAELGSATAASLLRAKSAASNLPASRWSCEPVDCDAHWGDWSECDSPCYRGAQRRRWIVTRRAKCGGKACEHDDGYFEERPCEGENVNCCPGEWGAWTPCTEECGGLGVRGRQFDVDIDRAPAGCHVPKVQEESCNTHACSVDCVGGWSDWGNCDAVCGKGTQRRTYEVTRAAEGEGKKCAIQEGATETRACTGQAEDSPLCAGLSCQGHWDEWGECSKPCGRGERNRTFVVTRRRQRGGGICEAEDGAVEVSTCNLETCPEAADCKGRWSAFSRCSAKCEGGTKRRRWHVIESEKAGGICPLRGAEETLPCNDRPCAQNCRGGWGPWSSCTVSCGGGTRSRSYTVITEATEGGEVCPHVAGETEVELCNKHACPSDCVGGFTQWSGSCPKCGTEEEAKMMRTYIVEKAARDGGQDCDFADGYVETKHCEGVRECDVDCAGYFIDAQPPTCNRGKCVTPSSKSGEMTCSKKCGGGVVKKKWHITRKSSGNGEPCDLRDGEIVTSECNTHPCPVSCQGAWDLLPEAECTKKCGGGVIELTYTVRKEAANGGKKCEANHGDVKNIPCNEKKCEKRCDSEGKNCMVPCDGKFSEWSACDAKCGGGTRLRVFWVRQAAENGGEPCDWGDGHRESEKCNEQPCEE